MYITKNNFVNLQEAPLAMPLNNEINRIKIDTYLNNVNNLKSEDEKNIKSI